MKFLQQFEKDNKDIIEAIVHSNFVQGLVNGTLKQEIFDYYIVQDIYYLNDFARAAGICASKAKDRDIPFFTSVLEAALEENAQINKHYTQKTDFNKNMGQTPAGMHYASFILKLAALSPIETAFAGLYPCPWLYMYIG